MPEEAISEDRVKIIVGRELAQYEREVGNVRHGQNGEKLDKFADQLVKFGLNIADFIGVLRGVKMALGFLAALCTLILLLLTYLGTHPSGHAAISLHEDAVISQLNNADLR